MIGLPIDELTLIFCFCPVFCAIFARFMLMCYDYANLQQTSQLISIMLASIDLLFLPCMYFGASELQGKRERENGNW